MDIPKGNLQADLVYKNTPQRDLMLTFLPPLVKKYDKAPVYFIIPGGGWHSETRQSMIDFSEISVGNLRKEGFAVVSIDYRVCTEGAVMHKIITDCFDAARFISHFADVLGIDKDRFFVSGHSAGAHLALMVAYAPQDVFKDDYEFSDEFKVKAVAPMSPPTMLFDRTTYGLGDISEVFSKEDMEEQMKKTSPAAYVSECCPPTLLMAGTSDYLVYAISSEKLYEKLHECNVPCELRLSVGGGHCFEKIHETVEPSISLAGMQEYITQFVLKYVGE